MDNFELKKITEGKYRKESLVFHIYDSAKDKDFELATDHINRNTITLR